MRGPEHYREAERMIASAGALLTEAESGAVPDAGLVLQSAGLLLQSAQAHATLAAAAAIISAAPARVLTGDQGPVVAAFPETAWSRVFNGEDL